MTQYLARPAAALLLALAASACAAGPGPEPAPATVPAVATAAPAPDGHSHHGAVAAAPDTARHTEADVRFMSMMIGHHGQAIEMSLLAPTRDAGPAVRRLADRIVNAQQDEIATMQQWLRDRRRPVPAVRPTAAHAADGHHAHMPGMLTAEQLARLERARGAEFDRLFLAYMIQHHRGAVAMVTELFRTPGAGEDDTVFKFASDVNVDQVTEIARMQRMLAEAVLGTPAP